MEDLQVAHPAKPERLWRHFRKMQGEGAPAEPVDPVQGMLRLATKIGDAKSVRKLTIRANVERILREREEAKG